MNKTLFVNGNIILQDGISPGQVLVENGRIAAVSTDGAIHAEHCETVDLKGKYLSPGFIDIHTHGAAGCDFMDATRESMEKACRLHMQHGTTSIVPTTMTSTRESLLNMADYLQSVTMVQPGLPEILGFHMEGPYFAKNQRGAQDEKYLRNPDPEEYEEVLRRTDRIIRWSFAVELPGGMDLLETCVRHGIQASAGHTDATCREIQKAYEKGLTSLTHFYSCMPSVRRKNAYRVAGTVEAGYLLDDLYIEAIADGCHLPEELLRLIYHLKPSSRICLITDSCRAAGMPEGEYVLGSSTEGQKIIVEDGVAKLPDRSAFAGSVATTDRLVRTFHRATGAPLHEVVNMMTLNPASLIGVGDRKGSIQVGKDADLLVFDPDIRIEKVMVRGKFAG